MIDKLFSKIQEIIDHEYHYPTSSTGKLILREENENASCQEIPVKKHGKIFVIRFMVERKGRLLLFFANTHPAGSKMCDYIVIYPKEVKGNIKLFVFLCELKSNNTKGSGRQIRLGFYLAKYIISVASEFLKKDDKDSLVYVPEAVVEYRGLIFSVVGHRMSTNPRNERYNIVPGMNLRYQHVQCGQEWDVDAYCF